MRQPVRLDQVQRGLGILVGRQVPEALRAPHQARRPGVLVADVRCPDQDVVDAVALSRRGLERRIRKVLGRSVLAEIRRVRVEQVARMLAETNLPVSQIALALGFEGVDHIARYFRREKGMSPLKELEIAFTGIEVVKTGH